MVIENCIADVNIRNTISTDLRYVANVDIRNLFFFSSSYLFFSLFYLLSISSVKKIYIMYKY